MAAGGSAGERKLQVGGMSPMLTRFGGIEATA